MFDFKLFVYICEFFYVLLQCCLIVMYIRTLFLYFCLFQLIHRFFLVIRYNNFFTFDISLDLCDLGIFYARYFPNMWKTAFGSKQNRDILTKEAISWAACNGLVVSSSMYGESNDPTFTHAPFTLLPSLKMTKTEYTHLCSLSLIYHKLIDRVSRDSEFLIDCFSKTAKSDPDFLGKLLNIYKKVHKNGIKQPYYFGVFRNDFMKQTDDNKWIQIEINTIASAGSLMSDLVTKLHQFLIRKMNVLLPSHHGENTKDLPMFNDNNNGLARSLSKASDIVHNKYLNGRYRHIEKLTILMVVTEDEVNISDQRGLEYALLSKYNVYTIRRSLLYIHDNAKMTENGEFYVDNCFISVVYFRAGYSPKHYPSEKELKARLMIEECIAIKCPNIEYQLIGSKLMQIIFCDKGVLRNYLNESEIETIYAHFGMMRNLGECDEEMLDQIKNNPHEFVLKHTQREGGGNNLYNEEIVEFIENKMNENNMNNWIVMKRIYPKPVKTIQIRNFEQIEIDGISEFGVYSSYICDDKGHVECNEIIGTLVRTKPMSVSKGGVFSGYAVFDSVVVEGLDESNSIKVSQSFGRYWYLLCALLICVIAYIVNIIPRKHFW